MRRNRAPDVRLGDDPRLILGPMDADQQKPRILTAADLLSRGYSRRAREHAERRGDLTRIRHGVYALGSDLPVGPRAHEALLELRSRAAARTVASGTVLSHASALVMHGLPVHGMDTQVVSCHSPMGGRSRCSSR